MRYEELTKLCWGLLPDKILEIGTWNGIRGKQFCEAGAAYVGFDLFDEATDETDATEKNVKAHFTVEDVSKTLEGVEHELIKGNTRETLPAYEGGPFDFAFIDGGHSIETIQSDWAAVQRLMAPGGVVVFDDYYEGIDVSEYGCNEVIKDLDYFLSDSADPVQGGGKVRFAVVAV